MNLIIIQIDIDQFNGELYSMVQASDRILFRPIPSYPVTIQSLFLYQCKPYRITVDS